MKIFQHKGYTVMEFWDEFGMTCYWIRPCGHVTEISPGYIGEPLWPF